MHRKTFSKQDKRNRRNELQETKQPANAGDLKSEFLSIFKEYQLELDGRYDLHERLVKKGRDVTIESKRIIFLLHRITKDDKLTVLEDANRRLIDLREKNLRAIAEELIGKDSNQFLHSYSPGLEEFIEALSFYHYLKDGVLITWKQVQDMLEFSFDTPVADDAGGDVSDTLRLHISPTIYVLGIGDLSGELMRKCINDIGSGDVESPFRIRPFMRDILEGFGRFGNSPRELNNKLRVMYQNVSKVDAACYKIHVRRSEIPDYLLTDISLMSGNDTEENYVDM